MPGIEEISPAEARRRQLAGSRLVDVREPGEHALGLPEGALPVPRASLESDPTRITPDTGAELLLIEPRDRWSLVAVVGVTDLEGWVSNDFVTRAPASRSGPAVLSTTTRPEVAVSAPSDTWPCAAVTRIASSGSTSVLVIAPPCTPVVGVVAANKPPLPRATPRAVSVP